MSHPFQGRGPDLLEAPFPEESAGPGGTVVERVEAIGDDSGNGPGGDDDEVATGEHGPPVPLESSDLLAEEGPDELAGDKVPGDEDLAGGQGLDVEDDLLAVHPARPPAPGLAQFPASRRQAPGLPDSLAGAQTLPPQRRAPPAPPRVAPFSGSTGPIPPGDDAFEEPAPLEAGEAEMEAAPTRIERQEEILGLAEPSAEPRLTIIGGNNRGRECVLKRGDNSIGRGIDNDLVLADIAVSRKHTLICFESGRFVVRDLGSGNGTLVNGERVESRVLEDGDQLELGNTLLRFNCPPPAPGELAHLATVVTQREAVQAAGATAAVSRRAGQARRQPAGERSPMAAARGVLEGLNPRTKRLAIFGAAGLLVFLGLMVGVKAYINAKKREAAAQAAPKPDEILAQEFQEGITEFNARHWERARAHFLKVLALAPSQGHVRQYVEQASAEIVARDAVERARARLAGLDFTGARQELAKVKPASAYRGDALALGRKIDEEQVTALVRAARALEQAGDTAAALQKVKEAQALAPERAEVQELHASLSGSSRKGTKKAVEPEPRVALKVAARTTPRPAARVSGTEPAHRPASKKEAGPTPAKVVPAGAAKAAIALYKKRQWGPAYQALKEWADTQKGKKHKSAVALAESVRLVGQSWTRAEQARQPSQMLKYYNDALVADARVEKGPHQKALKELLVKAARMQASTAFTKKQYAEAYSAVKLAEKHGGKGDPGLQKVLQALNRQAEEIFNRAYTIRTSNLAQARRLWQEVLRMVPPTSAIYQKAYGWLNNSSPSYQDEDED